MIKYLFLLLACLTGGALASTEDSINTETQLYIVAGILGGACLLLTIASIYNSVTIISLQSKIAVLQAAGVATVKAVTNVAENSPMTSKDPYRRQESRGYRMERMNPYYEDYRNSRPHGVQPSRGYQDDRRPPSGYY